MERGAGGRVRGVAMVALSAVALGCGPAGPGPGGSGPAPAALASPGPAFDRFAALVQPGQWRGTVADTVEVWVCRIPADSTAPTYGGLPLRLEVTPDDLVPALAPLGDYFDRLSNGTYRPTFTRGGTVDLGPADGPAACVDAALDASSPAATVVLAVADAEHAEGEPGGQGSGGEPCPDITPCPAALSRRAAYVGAADFHPDWAEAPPLDLVAHELGHTIGLVHSAFDATSTQPYQSALDVMSNSAAARAAQPERRDAPGTLAVQRLIAGWLPLDAVTTVPPAGGEVTLVRADGASGSRVLVLPVDATAFVAVEVVVADGLQAHLPASGVAVHLVDTATGAVVVSPTGYMAPGSLLGPGESIVAHQWRISVGDGWRTTVALAGA